MRPPDHQAPKSWFTYIHNQFLWLLIGSYALAAFWPTWGIAIKQWKLVQFSSPGTALTLPMLLLSWLLFNAGLGVSLSEIRAVVARPRLLVFGLAANLLVPILFLGCVSVVVFPWLTSDAKQVLLAGLAVIAAVPIATSSTAWCQNANGNLALGLGLLLVSTLFSPLTTPLTLGLANHLAPEFSASGLHQLSASYAIGFLIVCVLLPTALGFLAHGIVGAARVQRARPALKLINLVSLLVLNYSNASISLPQFVARPDGGFLLLMTVVTGLMCATAFGAAWLIARLLQATDDERTALLFSLGMNNNGVGLVLASLALTADSRVLLPIILYNLWQHLIAGAIDHWLCCD